MKKKIILTNAWMGLMILLAISFQSLDSFGHLVKQFSEKHCHHKYALNKTEVGHAHEGFDHCFVCEFALSSFILPSKINYTSQKVEIVTQYFPDYSKEITHFFRGSLFALRAPPNFIV